MKKYLIFVAAFLILFSTDGISDQKQVIEKLREGKIKLTLDDLKALVVSEPDSIIIDARGPKAFSAGHIPSAINIPGWDIETNLYKVPDKEKMIICYCDGSGCSVSYLLADVLKKRGYVKVAVYDGGIRDWKVKNIPLIDSTQNNLPLINHGDLSLLLNTGAPILIFDTRAGPILNTIKGAGHTPYNKLNLNTPGLPEKKDQLIVLFGSTPIDPSPYLAAKTLRQMGYSNIYLYKPGFSGWKSW